jgi:hypothetical protein
MSHAKRSRQQLCHNNPSSAAQALLSYFMAITGDCTVHDYLRQLAVFPWCLAPQTQACMLPPLGKAHMFALSVGSMPHCQHCSTASQRPYFCKTSLKHHPLQLLQHGAQLL